MTLREPASSRFFATDADFDRLLPPPEREVAGRFWTPLSVTRRAMQILGDLGVRRVLDVGSGPGKFCVVGALHHREVEFVGIEQRPHLVEIAERLAEDLCVPNATFRTGDVTRASWEGFDALYAFNSFAENIFAVGDRLDDTVELSKARYIADVLIVASKLAALPVGAHLVTYHGLGGPIPDTYTRVRTEAAGTAWLHVWRRERAGAAKSFWLEDDAQIRSVTPTQVRRLLRGVGVTGIPDAGGPLGKREL